MTTNLGEAQVPIRATLDKIDGDLNAAKSKIQGALGGLKSIGQSVGKVALAGVLTGVAAVAVGVAAIGVTAFGVSNDVKTATASIQASLGTTAEESERLANIAGEVWANNFAGSIEESASAVAVIRQQLGDLADNELQRATENAFRLKDAFGVEVTESVDTAKTLMEQFGLTSDQAFDFIAKGMQNGLNRSGDFLETINEYSTQFANGGASAGQFFSLLESGLQGGMLGTDRAADAFKEFRVRIQDGSTTTKTALESIGISADELAAQMADGTVTAADAFQMVISKLNEVDDENLRIQAGVGLLGTQFEDLGTDAALALSLTGSSLEDMVGATDSLNARYNNLGDMVEGYKRRAMFALKPIGDILLNLGSQILPFVEKGFAFFEGTVVPAIEKVGAVAQSFFTKMQEGLTPIMAIKLAIWEAFPPEVAQTITNIIDTIHNLIRGFENLFVAQSFFEDDPPWLVSMKEAGDTIRPVIEYISQLVTSFVSWKDVAIVLAGAIASVVIPAVLSLVASMLPIIAVVLAAVAIVAFMRKAWEEDWGGIQGKVETAINFIKGIITTVMNFLQGFWSEHGDTILAVTSQIWSTLIQTIDTSINAINNVIQAVVSVLEAFWAKHGETILTKAKEVWELIKNNVESFLTIISAVFAAFKSAFEGDWSGFGTNLRIVWDETWQAIINFISGLWGLIGPLLTGAITNIIDLFRNTNWGDVGRGIVDGIASAIRNGVGAIKEAAKSAAQAALQAALAFLGISSPSKVTYKKIGTPYIEGIVNAIRDGQRLIDSTVRSTMDIQPQLAFPTSTDVFSGTNIAVDARGSSDPRAVELAAERAVDRALSKVGRKIDERRR